MSGWRDRWAPVLAAGLVAVVAASVVGLLRVANDQGIRALRRAKLAQVQATANSFNARFEAQLSGVSGLGGTAWQLVPGSKADEAVLQTFNRLVPNAKSGFFLIDGRDRVTAGVLLRPGRLGSTFAPPGWEQAKGALATKGAAILPVTTSGFTTELPSYAFVIAIRGATRGSVRGALVAEQALTSDSAFSLEIAQLRDKKAATAAWYFLDSNGAIVATTDTAGLGQRIDDRRYVTSHAGMTDIGHHIVATADVPALGWRVAFKEDRSEFVKPLSGPLQTAGLVLVLLLLGVGLLLVVILVRRLREAREQERRLRELTRSQAEFISVVSHELRTPVAGVLGFLQTTVDHWATLSDAERLSTVRRAVTNARRLQAMTRDVLDTESIESGRLGYVFHQVDLGAELQTAVEGSLNADATHQITLTPPAAPVVVEADPDRLQQVLSNLLENARKNSPASEPIEVETEVVQGAQPLVRVSVIDRGPGVEAESLERIFEKFVRGNDNAVTGTGLGLYIVRRIVEAHHGRIWCESVPGNRTAFTFELPLARTEASLAESVR
jgi:signal transduction histidine kinase